MSMSTVWVRQFPDARDKGTSPQNQYETTRRAPEDGAEPQPESREPPNNDDAADDSWCTAHVQYQAETFFALSTLLMNMKRNT